EGRANRETGCTAFLFFGGSAAESLRAVPSILRQREHEIRPLVRRLLDLFEPRREEPVAGRGGQRDVLPAVDLVGRGHTLGSARQLVRPHDFAAVAIVGT